MKPNKKIKFRTASGVQYEIIFRKIEKEDLRGTKLKGNIVGLCDSPRRKNPKIIIDPNQTHWEILSTLIHEIFHAYEWNRTEKKTEHFDKTLTKIIQKSGFKLKIN